MRYLDAGAVAALGPAAAVRAVVDALQGGLDPATDPARVSVALANGQFLLMPSQTPARAGVKVVTAAPGNPARGLPRIQATYLLFDADDLSLEAVLDGTALTTLRTAAVSVAAVLGLLPERALRVAVVGAGPQAIGHASTLAALRQIETLTHLVRDPARTPLDALALGSPRAEEVLRAADVVVCATSARSPLFESSLLSNDAVVIAVGSHEPDARELDPALLGRATVIVEDHATALREAGDVVLAIADGALSEERLLTMRDVVVGAVEVPADRPVVFKGVGMSWQDLVIAAAVLEHTEVVQSTVSGGGDSVPETSVAHGRCLCGGVRYTVSGHLDDVINCHCVRCRQFTGHHMAATSASHEEISIDDADALLRWFHPVPEAGYAFCSRCGSSMFWQSMAEPARLSICAGTLDPPTGLRTREAWWISQASDYHSRPDLPELVTE